MQASPWKKLFCCDRPRPRETCTAHTTTTIIAVLARIETTTSRCRPLSILELALKIHGSNPVSLLHGCILRGPECQIIAQELHDQGRVLVRFLGDRVKLSNRMLECSASHLACLLLIPKYLVMEDGEVQCQAKADRVRHSQVLRCLRHRFIVGHACILGSCRLFIARFELGDVPVV